MRPWPPVSAPVRVARGPAIGRGPVRGEGHEPGGEHHLDVAAPGTASDASAPSDRATCTGEPGAAARLAAAHEPVAVVPQGARDRGRDDRRQGAADRLERCRAEHEDRGRRDDGAADAEHAGEHAGEEPGDEDQDDRDQVRHRGRHYRSPAGTLARMPNGLDRCGVSTSRSSPRSPPTARWRSTPSPRCATSTSMPARPASSPLGTTGESSALDRGREARRGRRVLGGVCRSGTRS